MIRKHHLNFRKLFIIILLVLSLTTISACKKQTETIDNVIAIGYVGDDIYLINSDGDSLLLEGFDLIQEVVDNYMFYRKDGSYGYINIKGEVIIDATYDKAYAMKENKAVVVKNNIHYIIDNLGNTLYQLPTNITSSSYFSQNKLVVERDGKFAYLTYNEEAKTFTLPGEFPYDFAGPFKDGYSVVGLESNVAVEAGAPSQVTVKYNYLGLNNILLFEEYLFDEADSFTGGIAKVGIFKKSVRVDAISTTGSIQSGSRYYDLMVYNYINTNGSYIIDQTTNKPLECHYGEAINDGVIITALMNHYLNDALEVNLFKKYTFYQIDGTKKYDSCWQYTSVNNINVFWPTNLESLGPNHIFACGKQSVSWSFQLAIEDELQFKPIYLTIDNKTSWIQELADEYFTNTQFIENVLRYPYHLSDIKTPEFSTDTRPLCVAQLNFNDNGKYAIIQFNYDETVYETTYSFENAYSAYYIVPAIYDRIVM